jgi:hypothetical protein
MSSQLFVHFKYIASTGHTNLKDIHGMQDYKFKLCFVVIYSEFKDKFAKKL